MSGESRFPRILSRRDKRRGQSKVFPNLQHVLATLQASSLGDFFVSEGRLILQRACILLGFTVVEVEALQ